MSRLFQGTRVLVAAACLSAGCRGGERDDAPRIDRLQTTYDQLHTRLEKAVAAEPLVSAAFKDAGTVGLALRASLIEEAAGRLAQRYLDAVTVDLKNVAGRGSGDIEKGTFLGNVKVGSWTVEVGLGSLVGRLRAGAPNVRLRAPDMVHINLPVDVAESPGEASIRFAWHSAGLTNVICRDFEIVRTVHGRVLTQTRQLSGSYRLSNRGERMTATPAFPDEHIQVRLDLTPQSWAIVEEALQSQNTFGRCGMLIKPAHGVALLKDLAERGIPVKLPRAVFRIVDVPARFQPSVKVNARAVDLNVRAQSLRIEGQTFWTSARVEVQARTVVATTR